MLHSWSVSLKLQALCLSLSLSSCRPSLFLPFLSLSRWPWERRGHTSQVPPGHTSSCSWLLLDLHFSNKFHITCIRNFRHCILYILCCQWFCIWDIYSWSSVLGEGRTHEGLRTYRKMKELCPPSKRTLVIGDPLDLQGKVMPISKRIHWSRGDAFIWYSAV